MQNPKDLALEQGFTEGGINHRRWTAKTGKRDFPKNVRIKEQSARALYSDTIRPKDKVLSPFEMIIR